MMEREFRVEITPQAQRQIHEIGRYIANELFSPDAAFRVVDKLEAGISLLASAPEIAPLMDEEPWYSRGVHKFPIGKFIAYYLVMEEIRAIRVIAVVYGKRDQKEQLGKVIEDK